MQFTDKIKKLLHSVPRGFRISEDEEYPQTATRIKHCIEAKKGKILSLLTKYKKSTNWKNASCYKCIRESLQII